MKKMLATATVALTLSGITGAGLAVGLASPADAATPSAVTTAHGAASHPLRAWLRAHRGTVARHVAVISARTIKITPKALVAALRSGESIAQVAQAHGVSAQSVVNALVQAGDTQVGRAVTDHKLTSAQGAKIEAALPAVASKIVNHVFA